MFDKVLKEGMFSNKMALQFNDGKVSTRTKKFKPHRGEYWFVNLPFDSNYEVGSLLVEFLSTDFDSLENFKLFQSKWGTSGFYDFSENLRNLGTKNIYNELEFSETIELIRKDIVIDMKEIQQYFRIATNYCLEYTDEWKDYSIHQRYYLISDEDEPVRKELAKILPKMNEYSNNVRHMFQVEVIENSVNRNLSSNYEDMVKSSTFNPVEIYESSNIAGLLSIEFKEMIKKQIYIKRCENCSLFFLPENRIDTLYCTRIQATKTGSKSTCQQIGATRKYNKSVKDNIVYKEYRKRYKTNYARVKNGMWNDARWDVWSKAASKEFNVYKTEISEDKIDDFIKWLHKSSTSSWYENHKEEE